MKGIALLGVLALAPLAQAGTPFAGRDLTPPADFISPGPGAIGTRVEMVMPPTNPAGVYAGRDLTPSAAFIAPSTGQRVGTRVMPAHKPLGDSGPGYMPSAGGSPGHDAGSFGYDDE